MRSTGRRTGSSGRRPGGSGPRPRRRARTTPRSTGSIGRPDARASVDQPLVELVDHRRPLVGPRCRPPGPPGRLQLGGHLLGEIDEGGPVHVGPAVRGRIGAARRRGPAGAAGRWRRGWRCPRSSGVSDLDRRRLVDRADAEEVPDEVCVRAGPPLLDLRWRHRTGQRRRRERRQVAVELGQPGAGSTVARAPAPWPARCRPSPADAGGRPDPPERPPRGHGSGARRPRPGTPSRPAHGRGSPSSARRRAPPRASATVG